MPKSSPNPLNTHADSQEKVVQCRMCGSGRLEEILNLGHHPPSNGLLTQEALTNPETHYPLSLLLCTNCGLVQLSYVVSKEVLFGESYPYDTSASRTLTEHFGTLASGLKERFLLNDHNLAVDIGSNVGVLVRAFQDQGVRGLGVEPAENMASRANSLGAPTICGFFSANLAHQMTTSHGRASVICATNVFAHIDDLADVVSGVRELLTPNGTYVIEVQYFLDMVQNLEYDQIYHEHYSYMTLLPLVRFFQAQGMEVFDVEHVSTHGGSLRVFTGFPGRHQVADSVAVLLAEEDMSGVHRLETLAKFASQVTDSRDSLVELLVTLKSQGKRIAGISAPAKASTLLNFCRISSNLVEFLTDSAPSKTGLFIPGMHVPVVPESRLLEVQPDCALILAWNIKEELMTKFAEYGHRGGRFIIPIPRPAIVEV
jgi:hypothetical protein